MNIIKRYCAFYIYLGIGYYYEGGRDLYITNIIESSKYIKEATIQITNFFNSLNFYPGYIFFNNILKGRKKKEWDCGISVSIMVQFKESIHQRSEVKIATLSFFTRKYL